MDNLDVLIDLDKSVFENEYMVVKEVLFEIPTQSANWVKRVQIVNWKMKGTSKDEIDIRRYSVKENKYQKGISFSARELSFFLENISKLEKFIDYTNNE